MSDFLFQNYQQPVKIIVNKITNADNLVVQENQNINSNQNEDKVLYIRFESIEKEEKKLKALQEILKEHHGNIPVVIFDQETKKQKAFKREFYACSDEKLIKMLEKMFGNKNIVLKSRENWSIDRRFKTFALNNDRIANGRFIN